MSTHSKLPAIRNFAGLAEVVEDVAAATRIYEEVFGLEVDALDADHAEVRLPGLPRLAIWSRRAAAQSIYGDWSRSTEVPLGLLLGLEVESVDQETAEAVMNGMDFLQGPRRQHDGLVTSRFRLASGALAELSQRDEE